MVTVVVPTVSRVMAEIQIVLNLGIAIEVASVYTVALVATTRAVSAIAVLAASVGAVMVATSTRDSVP
jgi:hypothetical protein